MPISRHFEIVYRLLHKRTITAGELAQHFEVSTRTIYRDIDVLSAAGIPVYSSKGKGGGISLLEGYTFNTSLLTGSEQDDVLMGLQTLTAAGVPEMDDVLGKFARLFKKDRPNWLEVDFSPWGTEESKQYVFPLLRRAIAERSVISFRYYNTAREESLRNVEPAQLIFKSQSWYLAGHCLTSDDSRVFKISRMRDIMDTERTFEPRLAVPSIDLAEAQAARDMVEVTLRISAEGAYRVYDEFAGPRVTVNEDGSFTVKADFSPGPWLDSYLLSFAPLLEGLSPESLRLRLLSQLDDFRDKLKSGSTDPQN
jgi:predicted DNA-binding transcriptional regulator YafY